MKVAHAGGEANVRKERETEFRKGRQSKKMPYPAHERFGPLKLNTAWGSLGAGVEHIQGFSHPSGEGN